jgi:hypothetical protein
MMQRLSEGQCFTRRDIAALFGGNARAFLPRVNGGDIVAGCFDPEMNPRVPYEILVHNAPNALLNAQRYLEQSRRKLSEVDGKIPHSEFRTPHSAVPVFLRRAPNVWEFVGRYRAVSYTEDPHEVEVRVYEIRPRVYERHVREYGQIRGILFLEEA